MGREGSGEERGGQGLEGSDRARVRRGTRPRIERAGAMPWEQPASLHHRGVVRLRYPLECRDLTFVIERRGEVVHLESRTYLCRVRSERPANTFN